MAPLSEHEQKILEEIERNLDEDPRFASKRADPARRLKLGIAIFVVGFGTLIAFFISRSLVVGVLAFGAMVAGIVLVAGALHPMFLGRDRSDSPGGRLQSRMKKWEQYLRSRYRKRP